MGEQIAGKKPWRLGSRDVIAVLIAAMHPGTWNLTPETCSYIVSRNSRHTLPFLSRATFPAYGEKFRMGMEQRAKHG
jgi:hypothetical protein